MRYSIRPLLTGVRTPDQGIMTYQQGYGTSIWLPIWAFLLQGASKNILVDTGLDEDELIVPAGFTEETSLEPCSMGENLEKAGLSIDDIDIVVNTHLHDDHCGNNRLFPRATFYAHRDELAFCRDPHPLDHRYDQYFIEENEFEEITQDREILPGLKVMHMPGHTVGCLSVEVGTGQGTAIITGFCCNRKNFPANGPAVCPGVHIDASKAWDSIQKVKQSGAFIIPMHDLELEYIPA
jgi:glyoxylase-like metal-dependent hydrolase (beta-lactamase superfamily II)